MLYRILSYGWVAFLSNALDEISPAESLELGLLHCLPPGNDASGPPTSVWQGHTLRGGYMWDVDHRTSCEVYGQ
jgi:hypothetical protein